jgi:hypothetical protein
MNGLYVEDPDDNGKTNDGRPLPWLDVIGNHDALTFGNFVPGERMSTETLLRGIEGRVLERWYGGFLEILGSAWIKMDTAIDRRGCAGCNDALVA